MSLLDKYTIVEACTSSETGYQFQELSKMLKGEEIGVKDSRNIPFFPILYIYNQYP